MFHLLINVINNRSYWLSYCALSVYQILRTRLGIVIQSEINVISVVANVQTFPFGISPCKLGENDIGAGLEAEIIFPYPFLLQLRIDLVDKLVWNVFTTFLLNSHYWGILRLLWLSIFISLDLAWAPPGEVFFWNILSLGKSPLYSLWIGTKGTRITLYVFSHLFRNQLKCSFLYVNIRVIKCMKLLHQVISSYTLCALCA